jgi:hypothetical protein
MGRVKTRPYKNWGALVNAGAPNFLFVPHAEGGLLCYTLYRSNTSWAGLQRE